MLLHSPPPPQGTSLVVSKAALYGATRSKPGPLRAQRPTRRLLPSRNQLRRHPRRMKGRSAALLSTVLRTDGGVDRYRSHFFRRVAVRCWSCLSRLVLSPVLAQDNRLLQALLTQQQALRMMTDHLNDLTRIIARLYCLNQASPRVCQSLHACLYGCMKRCRPLPAIQHK